MQTWVFIVISNACLKFFAASVQPERYATLAPQGIADSCEYLYISNMNDLHTAIQSYGLFGESSHLPDVMHCETIAARSVLHGWELAPHRHARLHQVLLLQSGGGAASLDGVTHTLRAGSLVNVPPGHVHAFRFKRGTKGWVATLADELLDEILLRVGDVRSDLGRCGVVAASPAIQLAMQQIWQEFSGRSKSRALVLRGLASSLLGWVARALAEEAPLQTPLRALDVVQRFKLLIAEHFLAHWRVADYARALCLSPTHLSRLTRAATGESARHLIEARTMREARRHLAYTSLSISTIAYAMGYGDPAYFTRAFTQDAGMSPRAFRAQLAAPA
jgi:AraC family transcriptional regulator, transcriptional activator of pobA